MLVSSFIPKETLIGGFFNTLGNSGWGLLVVLAGLLIRTKGRTLYSFGDMMSKGVIWEIVFMLATVFTLVAAVTEDKTGVSEFLIGIISPMQQSLGPLPFLLLVMLIFVLVSNISNTVAVACVFIPVLYVITQGSDFNMLFFTGATVFVSNVSFLVPSASVNAVMIFEKERWISAKWRTVLAIFSMLATYIVMIAVGLPLSGIL